MLSGYLTLNKKISCEICEDKSCAVSVLMEKQIALLDQNSHEIEIKKGETIIRSGVLNSHIIYLKEGYVKEFIVGLNNKAKILQIIKPRAYLGLHSLFGDRVTHFSYKALEKLRVCYIDINVFKQLVRENGDFAHELLIYVCQESLYNYNRFINQIQKNTNGRFADVLIYLSEDIFNSRTFELPLTRQELSELIGISRENTARVISKFKSDGIIDISGKTIEIIKTELLRKISTNG
jgi:CRP-like cAMP-binding protein